MTESETSTEFARGTNKLVTSCAVLTAAVVLAFPVFGWFGYSHSGAAGLVAALVAGMVCWLGACVALVITGLFRGTTHAVSGVLASTLFRLGIPLSAGLFLSSLGGALAKAGVFGMVLCYYLITLVVETILSLRLIVPTPKAPKVS